MGRSMAFWPCWETRQKMKEPRGQENWINGVKRRGGKLYKSKWFSERRFSTLAATNKWLIREE
jgi:hypothetical protein